MPQLVCRGHRLFYRQEGRGALLLILPGNTASSAHHRGELEHFGRRFWAVSPDFWGTGASERLNVWPDDWHEQAAHDVAALVEHLGTSSAYVMGASGGGVIALLMAILHPRVVRAVIADSCGEWYPADAWHQRIAERRQRTPGQVAFWRAGHGDDWEQVVEADSRMLLRRAEKGVLDWYNGRLGEIQCPVLLTVSLGDEMLPDPGGQVCDMVRQMRSSRALVWPEGGHPLMWSRAEDFRRAADHFLDTCGV